MTGSRLLPEEPNPFCLQGGRQVPPKPGIAVAVSKGGSFVGYVHEFMCRERWQETLYFILAVLFAFAGRPAPGQEAKPNLTGTWTLNLAKSKLAYAHPYRSDSYEIKHQEPKIVVVHNFGDESETFSYVVDGKERLARLGRNGDHIRAKAMWEGSSLVLERQQTLLAGGTLSTSRYTLSQDGKSLVITHHVKESALGSPGDEWLVYDKK